jgi:hypothetical protein
MDRCCVELGFQSGQRRMAKKVSSSDAPAPYNAIALRKTQAISAGAGCEGVRFATCSSSSRCFQRALCRSLGWRHPALHRDGEGRASKPRRRAKQDTCGVPLDGYPPPSSRAHDIQSRTPSSVKLPWLGNRIKRYKSTKKGIRGKFGCFL